MPAGLHFDKTTGTISGIPKSLSPQTTYTVSITNSSGTANTPLSIQVTAIALPVTWAGFTARQINNQVLLEWKTASEQHTKDFVVEHSADGIHWTNIGKVAAAGESRSIKTYYFMHSQPALMNYYRLLQRDKDDRSAYSSVIKLNLKSGLNGLKILGNPVKGKELVIALEKADDVIITTHLGQIIYQKQLSSGIHKIRLEGKAGGVYVVRSSFQTIQFILE